MSVVPMKQRDEDRAWETLIAWLTNEGYTPNFIRAACEAHETRIAQAAKSAWGHAENKETLDPLLMA